MRFSFGDTLLLSSGHCIDPQADIHYLRQHLLHTFDYIKAIGVNIGKHLFYKASQHNLEIMNNMI